MMQELLSVMLKPISTITTPRGGWSVSLPEIAPDFKFSCPTYSGFITGLARLLITNNKDWHGWEADLVDRMCRERSDIKSFDEEAPARAMTADDVLRFLRTLYEMRGNATAPVDEQMRRAEICMACPKRGRIACGMCGSVARFMTELSTGQDSRHLHGLHKQSCLVCGCDLPSAIKYPLHVLRAVDQKMGTDASDYPPTCWKLDASTP